MTSTIKPTKRFGRIVGIEPAPTEGPARSNFTGAILALCRLSPSEMLRVVELHITTREGIPGFALEEMANRLGRHGHELQRIAAHGK